jgi:hypothetical protein
MIPRRNSNFEGRLQLKQNPLFSTRGITPEKARIEPKEILTKEAIMTAMSTPRTSRSENVVVIPSSEQQDKPEVDIVIQS